jgi:negative regulator of flagellin synthesis FlgM
VTESIKGLDGGSIGSDGGNPIEKIRISTAISPASTEPSPAVQTDSVHITQSARSLAALSQAVHDSPEIDAGRVAAAQQAIDSGQYTVSPERIATRMLQLEQDLGSTTS